MTPVPWSTYDKPASKPTFLDLLQSRLAAVDISKPGTISDTIPSDGVVLGVMSDQAKRLIVLRDVVADKGNDLAADLDSQSDEPTQTQIGELDRLVRENIVLNDLLWYTVREELNIFHLNHVGVSTGWLVYYVPDKAERPNPLFTIPRGEHQPSILDILPLRMPWP